MAAPTPATTAGEVSIDSARSISGVQVGPLANVPLQRVEEVGIALIQPVAAGVDSEAKRYADQRDLEAERQDGGEGAVHHRDHPRHAGDGDRFGQRAVEADLEP